MKKRELFVFAGQSNMQGAAFLPPTHIPALKDSYEYKHKPRRFGEKHGTFTTTPYPCGEFSYCDLEAVYGDNPTADTKGTVTNYRENAYFVPGMCNCNAERTSGKGFAEYSEADFQPGATLAPLFAEAWEEKGGACAYAHMAKGCCSILHYFSPEMAQRYSELAKVAKANGEDCREILPPLGKGRANNGIVYFDEKATDFFRDAEERFAGEDLSEKDFVWLQGEADTWATPDEYCLLLTVLFEHLKTLGFTRFLVYRIDYFGAETILNVMKGQEKFCKTVPGAYMLSRLASYFPYANRDESEWFAIPPKTEWDKTRDSFLGIKYEYAGNKTLNQHINEKGFTLLAKAGVENLWNLLRFGKMPDLEEEYIIKMREK